MTFADPTALGPWTAHRPGLRSVGRCVRSWVEDRLERVVLIALVLVVGWVICLLATTEDRLSATTGDACVAMAVPDARAFAGVLGDHRAVRESFARERCGGS